MTIIRHGLGAILISMPALFTASPGAAQESAIASDSEAVALIADRADAQETRDRQIVQSQGLMERSGFVPPAPSFQLSTNSDKTEVSIGLSAEVGATSSQRIGDDDHRVSSTTRFSIQGFAPVDEHGGDVFVNLASPLDGARLKFGITRYTSRYTITRAAIDRAREVLNRSLSNCLTRQVNAWQTGRQQADRDLAGRYLADFATEMSRPQPRAESILPRINERQADGKAVFGDIPAEVRDACLVGQAEGSVDDNEDLIRRFGGRRDSADVEALTRAVTGNAPTYFYGLEGAISHKSYSFLDRTGFQLSEQGHVGYQVSAFGGVIGGSGNWSLRAGISRSQRYSAADPIELCRPAPTAGQTECLTGPDGPPGRSRRTVLSIEGRRLFNLGGGLISSVGIAPEFAYDFDSDNYSVDVPIYFAPNSEGALTGGVRFGYGSKDDEFSFGLFVGVPFTILQ